MPSKLNIFDYFCFVLSSVFEAAISINKKAFLRHCVPIFIFALLGTAFSAFVTALIVNKGSSYLTATTIPVIDSLLFGTLISSIDPIAVLSVLTNLGMDSNDAIFVIIFGESLLNDGVAIVLYDTLLGFLSDHTDLTIAAIWSAFEHFFVGRLTIYGVKQSSNLTNMLLKWPLDR